MERKKILLLSDSAKIHTGFARVTKELWTYLNKTGKYEINQIGWFHQPSNEEVTFPIHTTNKDERGNITQEDKYATKSFPGYVDKFKPDLVWTLGDPWMVDHVAKASNRSSFKWVMYCPIDGHPMPSKWAHTFRDADVAVAYGQYGVNVIKHRAPDADIGYIYHGVNTRNFKPLSEQAAMDARKSLLQVDKDKILIGIVARNQPRKSFDKLFEAYYYVISGNYSNCDDCGKLSVWPYDLLSHVATPIKQCKHCHGVNISNGNPREDVRLYVHAAVIDCGWDLLDLQKDYGLLGKVFVNPSLKLGMGLSEHTLNGVYNSFDIFTLPTRGEGFGLPILEAMAAGVPVVVTDYSAHPEWAKGCGEMVPPICLEAEPLTNTRRAIIDTDCYVQSLVKLIDDKELRKKYGARGREVAESMDWSIIGKQWEDLIDSVLYPEGSIPDKISPLDFNYTLEEI